MKRTILFICALLFALSCFAQLEKMTLKRKYLLDKSGRKIMRDKEYKQKERVLLDSLYSVITKRVYNEIISDEKVLLFLDTTFLPKEEILNVENIDSLFFGPYELVLSRGSTLGFWIEGSLYPDEENAKLKHFFNYFEVIEYIYLEEQLPFHLIEKIKVDFKFLFENDPVQWAYEYKVYDWDHIELISKVFVLAEGEAIIEIN